MQTNPITFVPYLRSVLWGGNKIAEYKNIHSEKNDIGESWEISALPSHDSVVAEGPYKGQTLSSLCEEFGHELLGKSVVKHYGMFFPLLVKIIDANDNLSLQVHPNDELAGRRHNSLGKTEMWYIVSAKEDAKIYSGFNTILNSKKFEQWATEGRLISAVGCHTSSPGDVFFLPSGRIHAIGAGNLLVEIQESSDITYRVDDFGRIDSSGKPRELHIELAKEALDYQVYDDYKSSFSDNDKEDVSLIKCSHFDVNRLKISKGTKQIPSDNESFTIIICIDGKLRLSSDDTPQISLSAGHTALIPAASKKISVSGNGTLLYAKSK